MASRFYNPFPQFFTDSGKVAAGGFVNFWANGTTNNQNTFPIVELTGDPNANPVPLDAAGIPTVPIFAAEASVFSVRVIDSDSVVLRATADDVSFVRENVITAADVVAALTANAVAGVYNGTQMTGTAFANFASNLDLTAAGSIDTSLGALTVGAVSGAAVFADLSADGDVNANTGNFVVGTSGKGVDFSATSDGSGTTTSEILDDYEEGTFTPTLQDSSNSDSEGQTYSTQNGRYTKIGDKVFFKIRLTVTSIGTLTGGDEAKIAGLPFTSISGANNEGGGVATFGSGLGLTAGFNVTGQIANSSDRLNLTVWDATTGTTPMTVTEFSADGSIDIFGDYEA